MDGIDEKQPDARTVIGSGRPLIYATASGDRIRVVIVGEVAPEEVSVTDPASGRPLVGETEHFMLGRTTLTYDAPRTSPVRITVGSDEVTL